MILAALAGTMNDLLSPTIERERAFVDDASHELRSPRDCGEVGD